MRGRSCNGSTRSSPNSLYPDRIGDMQRKTKKEQTRSDTTDPDLCRNVTKYAYNHKYKYAVEITLHFINIKELKFVYRHNGNKLAKVLVAYL